MIGYLLNFNGFLFYMIRKLLTQLKLTLHFVCLAFFFILSSHQGVTYRHITTTDPLSIHILEVDPAQCRIFPAHAKNRILARESVQTLAKKHQAIAAINGGFFKGVPWDGMPSGILKIDHAWYGLPTLPRAAIGWSPTTVLIDQLLTTATITVREQTFQIDGLNRSRQSHECVLYSPLFSTSTQTKDGLEAIIIDNTLIELREGGNCPIPSNGNVLSLGPEQVTTFWKNLPRNSPVKIQISVLPQNSKPSRIQWDFFPHIVGGTPLLIHEGRMIKDFSSEKTRATFLSNRHARTAVGILPNGHWLFVVVDGGNLRISRGATMLELAQLMFNLGCKDALNMDGGGSSTMVLDNKVVNDPYGDEDEDDGLKTVRKVSDAILIKGINE